MVLWKSLKNQLVVIMSLSNISTDSGSKGVENASIKLFIQEISPNGHNMSTITRGIGRKIHRHETYFESESSH